MKLKSASAPILAASLALAALGCQAQTPASLQVHASALADKATTGLPFQITSDQAVRLSREIQPSAASLQKLDALTVAGKPAPNLGDGQLQTVRHVLDSTGAIFFGLNGSGQFAGEGGIQPLGNDRYLYQVPTGRALVLTMAQNPHMLAINGFNLADTPNSFSLSVSASSQSQNNCTGTYYWWYWYYGSGCGTGGYWGWWYYYYYGRSYNNNQSNSNSNSTSAQNTQSIYNVNYIFGSSAPVVFSKVAVNQWRVSGYTIPESYLSGAGIGLAK